MTLSRIQRYLSLVEPLRNRMMRRKYGLPDHVSLQNAFLEADSDCRFSLAKCVIGGPANRGHSATRISLKDNSSLVMHAQSCIRSGATLEIQGNSQVTLGENSYVNFSSLICAGGGAGVDIGRECAISWNVQIMSYDYHVVVHSSGRESSYAEPIEIGDHCWIGAGATVLKGARLGANCIVAARAVVVAGDYPEGSLIAGNPGKIIRQSVSWRKLLEDEKKCIPGAVPGSEGARPWLKKTPTG